MCLSAFEDAFNFVLHLNCERRIQELLKYQIRLIGLMGPDLYLCDK